MILIGEKWIFKKVAGAGNTASYHLMVEDFYRGQLNHSEHYGWQFTSNDSNLQETMAKWFKEYIELKVE